MTTSIILGIIGLIAMIAGTAITNKNNKELTEKTQLDNYLYTDKLQENAQLRKADYYNKFESPLAIRTQLEQANLNPSLMYQNGTGSIGSSTPAAAPSINQNAPMQYKYEIDPLTMAQIKNIEADTNLKQKDAANKEQQTFNLKTEQEKLKTEINNIIELTENYKVQRQLTHLQSDYQEIINKYQDKLSNQQLEKLIKETDYAAENLKAIIMSNEITAATKKDIIENAKKQNQLITSQIMLNNANRKLTEAEEEQVYNAILNAQTELYIKQEQVYNEEERNRIYAESVNNELTKINNEYSLGLDRNAIEAAGNFWKSIPYLMGEALESGQYTTDRITRKAAK